MAFEELIELLRNPGEDGPPDTIYDDLTAEYNGVFDTSQARIAEFESALAERDAQIASLKSHNYDLLMQVRADNSAEVVDEADENDVEPDTDAGIDSLFGDKD